MQCKPAVGFDNAHQPGYVHLLVKRLTFLEFIGAMVRNSSEKHAEEVRDLVLPKMLTAISFMREFAPLKPSAFGAEGGVEDSKETDDEGSLLGLAQATNETYQKFRETVQPASKLAADLLFKTHTGAFDADFQAIACEELKNSSFSFQWADLVTLATDPKNLSKGLELSSLQAACKKWVQAAGATPTAVDPGAAIGEADRVLSAVVDHGSEDGDALRQKTITKLSESMKKFATLGHVENGEYEAFAFTKLIAQMKASRPTKGDGPPGSSEGIRAKAPPTRTLYVASAELFGPHNKTHDPDSFRGMIGGISTEFREVVKWLSSCKAGNDVVLVTDGRSDEMRKDLRKLFEPLSPTELWTIYDMEGSLNTDVRNPKRKVAWSCANMESVFAFLPLDNKSKNKLVARDTFTKCGESTNFSRSYSGVPFRNLKEIPRVTPEMKQSILGQAAVGAFEKARVQAEVQERGHPLFWGEWKPVALAASWIRDFEATEVVDLTPGTGAFFIASVFNNVHYFGICHNEAHEKWLRSLTERMFVAMVADKKVDIEPEVFSNVRKYLQRAIGAAQQLLPQRSAAFEEIVNVADDSDEAE